jgi:acyl-CoA thioesterase-1
VSSKLRGRKVINAGVPGEVSGEGLERFPGVLDAYPPQLSILIHGGNDLLRGMDRAQRRANLAVMTQLAQDRGVSVLMLGVSDSGLTLASADFYQSLAEEFSAPIDIRTLPAILSDRNLKSGYVHPNDQGYHEMSEAIYRLLSASGAV